MENNFHINKNCALSLGFTMRFKATRKWPILSFCKSDFLYRIKLNISLNCDKYSKKTENCSLSKFLLANPTRALTSTRLCDHSSFIDWILIKLRIIP